MTKESELRIFYELIHCTYLKSGSSFSSGILFFFEYLSCFLLSPAQVNTIKQTNNRTNDKHLEFMLQEFLFSSE